MLKCCQATTNSGNLITQHYKYAKRVLATDLQ